MVKSRKVLTNGHNIYFLVLLKPPTTEPPTTGQQGGQKECKI